MQKLTFVPRKFKKGSKGSVLVGTVALALIMAIGSIGLIQMTTASLNNETDSYNDLKALHAAESGAYMGARWLRAQSDATWRGLTSAHDPFGGTLSIGDMNVSVSVVVNIVSNVPVATISSSAYLGSAFKKRVNLGDVRAQTFCTFSTFIDNCNPVFIDETGNAVGAPSDWNGYGNRVFEGRTHFNNMVIRLSENADPSIPGYDTVIFRNGLVTCAKPTNTYWSALNYQGYSKKENSLGHNNNNYDYGIQCGQPGENWPATPKIVPRLDKIFTDRYEGNVDPVNVPLSGMHAQNFRNLYPGDIIDLPTSKDQGDDPAVYRPTLVFNRTTATYQYKDPATGDLMSIDLDNINNRFFCSHNNLNVYGIVTGRITVATDLGTSILPCGNLVTSDYDFNTLSSPPGSPNMIGLVAGKNIRFNAQWQKQFVGDAKPDTPRVTRRVTPAPGGTNPNGTIGTMHLSASLVAVNPYIDHFNNGKAVTLLGTAYWDHAIRKSYTDTAHVENYNLTVYGSQCFAGRPASAFSWGSAPTPNARSGHLATAPNSDPAEQKYLTDPRMANETMRPPGFPTLNTSTGLLVLNCNGWVEENR